METTPPPIDIHALKIAERTFTHQVRVDPTNMSARLNLARCLLLHSVYEAGCESIQFCEVAEPGGQEVTPSLHLLTDCLHQLLIVTHLTTKPKDREEALNLRRMVTLQGGERALEEMDKRSQSILAQLLSDLNQDTEDG